MLVTNLSNININPYAISIIIMAMMTNPKALILAAEVRYVCPGEYMRINHKV